VAAFTRLAGEAPEQLRDYCTGLVGYAHKHRELIRMFGRFPHRNRVLGRADTPEESAWLVEHPHYFG
jgi:uncharacterized protein (DUF924 family)